MMKIIELFMDMYMQKTYSEAKKKKINAQLEVKKQKPAKQIVLNQIIDSWVKS